MKESIYMLLFFITFLTNLLYMYNKLYTLNMKKISQFT